MDKNLQIFHNSFTEMVQRIRIAISNYRLYKAKNPTKANSEQSEGVPNFWDSDMGSGQNYGSY